MTRPGPVAVFSIVGVGKSPQQELLQRRGVLPPWEEKRKTATTEMLLVGVGVGACARGARSAEKSGLLCGRRWGCSAWLVRMASSGLVLSSSLPCAPHPCLQSHAPGTFAFFFGACFASMFDALSLCPIFLPEVNLWSISAAFCAPCSRCGRRSRVLSSCSYPTLVSRDGALAVNFYLYFNT